VLPLQALHQLEVGAEKLAHTAGIVSLHRQSATTFGSVEGEGRQNKVPAYSQRAPHGLQVCLAIDFLRKEVEHCSIVPKVDLCWQPHISGISGDPGHRLAPRSQASPSDLERRFGNIHHSQVIVASVEEAIHQKRGAPSDVDDGAVFCRRNCADQVQSGGRLSLEPTDFVKGLRLPHVLPMRFRIHRLPPGIGEYHERDTRSSIPESPLHYYFTPKPRGRNPDRRTRLTS